MDKKTYKVWDLFNGSTNSKNQIVPVSIEKLNWGITKLTFNNENEAKEYSKIYKWYNIQITWRFITIKPIDIKNK